MVIIHETPTSHELYHLPHPVDPAGDGIRPSVQVAAEHQLSAVQQNTLAGVV